MSTSDPHPPREVEHPELVARNTRTGLWLFAVYCLVYAGFVGLAAFSCSTMLIKPFGGVNLAIIYGFGLIVLALVLSLVYLALCRGSHRGQGD